MGNDFYERNEQLVAPGGEIRPAGEVFGWSVITRQYFERYRRPVMHTETNNIGRSADEAPRWLWKEFFNVRNLREQGVPVLGFTWFSLIDQVDWDSALALDRGVVNPLGLYDLGAPAPARRHGLQGAGPPVRRGAALTIRIGPRLHSGRCAKGGGAIARSIHGGRE